MSKRIEICASIGVGKTTLVKALAGHGFAPVYEAFAENPHLAEFYETFSPESAFRKDEWFLQEQQSQIGAISGDKPAVMDYSVTMSRAFVDAGANTPENKALLQALWNKAPQPDMVVVLRLPLEEQQARIAARSRGGESAIPSEYLQQLNRAIDRRLAELPAGVQVLEVDANRDFRKPHEVEQLARQIKRRIGQQTGQER